MGCMGHRYLSTHGCIQNDSLTGSQWEAGKQAKAQTLRFLSVTFHSAPTPSHVPQGHYGES